LKYFSVKAASNGGLRNNLPSTSGRFPRLILRIFTGARSISFLMTVLVLFFIGCQDPPLGSLEKARATLTRADREGATHYAEETYRTAEEVLKKGWMEMARQNGRLAPFRNYKAADSMLNLAYVLANEAINTTKNRIHDLSFIVQTERNDLREELNGWKEALNGLLARYRAEHHWNSAELAYRTSEKLLFNGEYDEARKTVAEGREALKRLSAVLAEYTNDEVKKLPVWRRWVEETVSDSRSSGGYAVIVDKARHKTYLIKAGRIIHTYNCDLGYNSAHQKLFSGDGATPEGKYQVTEVKKNGSSKYYKALLINYPNATDRSRFSENKSRGIISSHARIGGLIEFHGEGGRGRDWTEGCVALTNKEMDQLMQYVGHGTPITIVRRSDLWP
jgi:L,D-peptidoglycan transpeptidase YkuD (ErfK/YbiS/YcfS/YnhG family)